MTLKIYEWMTGEAQILVFDKILHWHIRRTGLMNEVEMNRVCEEGWMQVSTGWGEKVIYRRLLSFFLILIFPSNLSINDLIHGPARVALAPTSNLGVFLSPNRWGQLFCDRETGIKMYSINRTTNHKWAHQTWSLSPPSPLVIIVVL